MAWRALGPRAFSVTYHPRYAAALPHAPSDPLRAERILAFLASEGLVLRRCVMRPKPASLKSLARVHTTAYLDQVHQSEVLARVFGGPITDDQVDRLLDLQRLHVGGTTAAVRTALDRRATAVHLGGGLHHAHADHGAGFCVFNDVAVAIAEARHHGFNGRVLVIDLDLHDGDGTRAIFADDDTVHTLSIHARGWSEPSAPPARADTSVALGEQVEDEAYLAAVQEHVTTVVTSFQPRLVIYLAGADPAHDDQLGDWKISESGMLARDRLVIQSLRRHTRGPVPPLVVCLAGGYGPQAWRYGARFISTLFTGRASEPPSTETITLKRYRWLASLQDPLELTGGAPDNPFGFTEEDLHLPAWGMTRESRFLGYYTRHGIELTLERTGLLDRLRDLGYAAPTVTLALDDPSSHTLRIFGDADQDPLLCELRVSINRRDVPNLRLLMIEWLLLQNPAAPFSTGREPLPGQEHPGLGMASDTVGLLLVACERLHLDGLLWTPSHFHTAAPWLDLLVALDPEAHVRARALAALFADRSFATVHRALTNGEVIDQDTGEPVRWKPSPMVFPHSPHAQAWARAQRAKARDVTPPRLAWRRSP